MIDPVWPSNTGMNDRCMLCGETRTFTPALTRCPSCGLEERDRDGVSIGGRLAELDAALTPGPVNAEGEGWRADPYVLRSAATLKGLRYLPDDPRSLRGHVPFAATGRLFEAPQAKRPVALVMLARPADPGALANARALDTRFAEIVVMLDGGPAELKAERARPWPEGVRIVARRLNGDFGAQRNAAQRAVRACWAFHLDTDETPSDGLAAALPGLAALGERDRLGAIGFARRNLVDGTVSARFPDTQYRLVPRTMRFE
ncbi:MAG: hypothetical protein ACOC0V_02620, partial [Oceanicaulis sp.]